MKVLVFALTVITLMGLVHMADPFHFTALGVLGLILAAGRFWWRRRQAIPGTDPEYPLEADEPNRLRESALAVLCGLVLVALTAGISTSAERIPVLATFSPGDCAALEKTLDTLERGEGYQYGLALIDERLQKKVSPTCGRRLFGRKARFCLRWAAQSGGKLRLARLMAARVAAVEAGNGDLVAHCDSELRALELQTRIEQAASAAPAPKRVVLVLADVQFEINSDRLNPDGAKAVGRLVDSLNREFRDRLIGIEGHTDDTGPATLNDWLSRQRAETVKTDLVRAGVSPTRITTAGYAASVPLDPDPTPAARTRNRRVEIIVE